MSDWIIDIVDRVPYAQLRELLSDRLGVELDDALPRQEGPSSAVLPRLLHLSRPALDALALAADLNIKLDVLHALRALQETVIRHPARIGPLSRQKLEHGQQKLGYPLRLLDAEMILLPQHVGQCPVSQPVNVSQLAFAVKYLLRPFAGYT